MANETPRRAGQTGYWFGSFIVLALAAAGYFFLHVPSVEVTRLERGQAVTAIYASGNVEPVLMLEIAPKITARLTEFLVKESDSVKAGQALALLDDSEVSANLAQLQARLDWARQEAARAHALLARRTGTVQDRDKAESNLREALAAVAMVEKQRAEYTLAAPADGVIIRRDGDPGELISATQALFSMAALPPGHEADTSMPMPLRITAHVDEEDIPMVRTGQRVLIRADAFPEKSFEGAVASITPKGDPTERNFRVRIGLPPDTPLRIGMTAEINIIAAVQEDALLLPVGALRDGKAWLLRDGRLRQVDVASKPSASGKIAVTEGIGADDWVVTAPQSDFKDGQRRRAVMLETTAVR